MSLAQAKPPAGVFALVANHSQLVLNVSGGRQGRYVQLWDDAGNPDNQWEALLLPAAGVGVCALRNPKTGQLLGVAPASDPAVLGHRPFMMGMEAACHAYAQWKFFMFDPSPYPEAVMPVGNGTPGKGIVCIQNVLTGTFLNVPGGINFKGRTVWLWDNPHWTDCAWTVIRPVQWTPAAL
jgi:hypothetical protein